MLHYNSKLQSSIYCCENDQGKFPKLIIFKRTVLEENRNHTMVFMYLRMILPPLPQIIQHTGPVREEFGLKMDPFSFKIPGAVVGAVVYEVIPEVEVLVVREDQPFTGGFAQIFFYPQQLVNPGRLVIPGCRGEDVGVEPLRKPGIAFKGILHGTHFAEQAGDFI